MFSVLRPFPRLFALIAALAAFAAPAQNQRWERMD